MIIRTIVPGRTACLSCFDAAKKEGVERSKCLEGLPLPNKRLLRGSITLKEEKEVSEIVSFMSKLPTKLGALTEVDEGDTRDDDGSDAGSSKSVTPKRRKTKAMSARQRMEQAEKSQATEQEATRRILLMGRRVNAAQ